MHPCLVDSRSTTGSKSPFRRETDSLKRRQGAIVRVVRRDDYSDIAEMDSWDLRDFEFHIKAMSTVEPCRVRADHGYIRFAPKQQ